MKEEKGIQEIFDRFNHILNRLRALGKTYSNSELVRKILRALPKSWASKKDAILEAKDLNQLPLEELPGSILAYEMGLYEDEENGSKNDKRRGMALKSKVIEDSEAEEESDSDEEEIAMYARKLRRFIKKNKVWKKNRSQSSRDEPKKDFKKDFKKDSKKDNQIICYNCNKPGHVKQDCKLPKKNSKYVKNVSVSPSPNSLYLDIYLYI